MKALLAIASVCVCSAAAAHGQAPAPAPAAAARADAVVIPPDDGDYKIGAEDVLDIFGHRGQALPATPTHLSGFSGFVGGPGTCR